MRTITSSLLLGALCTLAFTSPAHAQSSSSSSVGSGNTLTDLLKSIEALAPDRASISRSTLSKDVSTYATLQTDTGRLRTRLQDHRRDCSDAIRRANRDSLMKTANQCYKSDTLQEANILKQQQAYIASAKVFSDTRKTQALKLLSELLGAESAIIDGIDADIFTKMEGLSEAKRNLHTQYRLPHLQAQRMLRADRQLTWIVFMSKSISENSGDHGLAAAQCLADAGAFFASAAASGDANALETGATMLPHCRELLLAIEQ